MKCAVAIFAKTIGLSPVKTRLAADIGQQSAEQFYAHSIDCVEALVSGAAEAFPETVFPVWVIAEEDGPKHWERRSFPVIWTGEGGLGSRLANVSETLFETYDAVMMIGTDSPHLSPSAILGAVSKLAGNPTHAVTGPAHDGGFYLFASTAPVSREIWESVDYSQSTTLGDLETRLHAAGVQIDRLAAEQDVDSLDDLLSLRKTLAGKRGELNTAQQTLLNWLENQNELF